MANQEIIFKPKCGQWTLVDGKPNWREQIGKGDQKTFEFYTPEQFGLKKSVTFSIVTSKEFANIDTLTSTSLVYFVQHVKVQVRPDQPDVWLLEQNAKIFMKNLRAQTTGIIPLKTNSWVIVTKTEFVRTTLEKIKELEKKRTVLAFHKYDALSDIYGFYSPAK